MKQAQASQQSAFIDVNYPAMAEETAPFNWVAAAMAFKNSTVPSSSLTICSHLHLQHRPPRNKVVSWFSAFCLPWFSIPERRAYVFQFVKLHFGLKVIDVLPQRAIITSIWKSWFSMLYRSARIGKALVFQFSYASYNL
jgi:hypothetical protein